MEIALYDPQHGFFARGGGAGRRGGDFLTSPEVGSLYGMCVARAIDRLWDALGAPDPFLVVEAGAGSGRLARDILRARPRCAPALRYVLVERSAALRAEQRGALALEPADEALGSFVRRPGVDEPVPAPRSGPVLASLADLPAIAADGAVVLANELLDNLPFGVAERGETGWHEVRIALRDDRFEEVLVPIPSGPNVPGARTGTRVPLPRATTEWLLGCEEVIRRGFLLLVDYVVDAAALPGRGGDWLRTYRAHARGASPLDDPGSCDITGDVVLEQLVSAAPFALLDVTTQAEWLRALGIDALVDEGRATWESRAHVGDLDALAGRSRVNEAAALTDPAGLGAHRVVLFGAGGAGSGFAWQG